MGIEHWVETTLGKTVIYKKGKKPNILEEEKSRGALPYINIAAFETGSIKQYADPKSSNVCRKNDILVVWDGARFGLTGSNQEGAIGSTIMCLTPLVIESEFLYKFIQSKYPEIQQNPKGSGIPHVDPDIFWNIPVPLPPLAEQHRIVASLDAIMERMERNKKRLDKIPALLKRFRQSVLADAMNGVLTEDWRKQNDVNEEWTEKFLKNIGDITGGITLNSKRQLLPLKMPYLRVGNVYSNQVILDEVKTIGITEKEINRALLKKGDLLIVEGNGSPDQIGRAAQWHGEVDNCLHQNHLIKFRTNNYYTSRFVLYYLLSFEGRKQIEEASKSTSGLYTLSLSKVSNLTIFIPLNVKEQQEIVLRVEQLFAFADKVEARYAKAKILLDKLPQSILAKAFRGELVAQDENDEPASVLLKRIEAAKLSIGKAKK